MKPPAPVTTTNSLPITALARESIPSRILAGAPARPRRRDAGVAMRAKPGDGAREPLVEGRRRVPTDEVACAGGVERAARLAVGTRRVPRELAREAGGLRHGAREVADQDLAPGPDVDRRRVVDGPRRGDDRLRGVLDVEELARGGPRAPEAHAPLPPLDGLDALPDDRGDDVRGRRLEVVAG